MTINDFYQLFVGIFALLASIFLLLSIILMIWGTIRIKKVLSLLISSAKKIDNSAIEIRDFVKRNIDYIEFQKARLESFSLLNTLISLIIHKKKGVQNAEDN